MRKTKHTFPFLYNPAVRQRGKTDPTVFENQTIYPIIPITLYYNGMEIRVEALVDSGADSLYLHKDVGDYLKLPKFKEVEGNGVGGKDKCYETEVGCKIGRAGKISDLTIIPALLPKESKDLPILFGRIPLFEEFTVIFEMHKEKIHLIPKEY